MRIIGGKYKGRIIKPVSGLNARPTTDFAKESLFNILNNRVDFESLKVLDLFSGTGSIAFEFASRGAENVHLVEKDHKHIAGIKSTIGKIGFDNIIGSEDYVRYANAEKAKGNNWMSYKEWLIKNV